MKMYIEPNRAEWSAICERPEVNTENLMDTVKLVFDEVKSSGDEAIRKYTHFYDRVDLDSLLVEASEIDSALERIEDSLKAAILVAKKNIETFHKSQQIAADKVETMPGVTCWQEARPIERVGIYIPGGTAPLFSSVLMLAIPAQIAGCKEIVLCTPPNKDGSVNDAILYAASVCGVTKVVKVGGIQAVAGLTFGTESIPKVNKIVGPGNQYVTAAKQYATLNNVAIDMPAGPSELLVLADAEADPSFVASDLLSQAEHGADSQVICVVSKELEVGNLIAEVDRQLAVLPRQATAAEALENSRIVVLANPQDQLDFINAYAPEHLILNVKDPEAVLAEVVSAGSVFLGENTPESVGDYASGTNHTLPTNGFAQMYSGVNLDTFQKKITVQKLTEEGLESLAETVVTMAEAEGLQAHANAVSVRLRKEVQL